MSEQLRKAADDLLNTAREFGWCDELGAVGSTVLVNLEQALSQTEAQQEPAKPLGNAGELFDDCILEEDKSILPNDDVYISREKLYTSPQLRRLSDVETDALIVWFEHNPNRSLKALIKGVQVKCGIIKPDAMIKGEEQ